MTHPLGRRSREPEPRTWIAATPSGRRALKIEALREIVSSADATTKRKRQAKPRLAIPKAPIPMLGPRSTLSRRLMSQQSR
ncbi:MAG: hypothetical protein ACYC0H_07740 [Solirubrobacteraceae bacterium]